MKFKPISTDGINTYSISDRKSKVSIADFASPPKPGGSVKDLLEALPNILGAKDLRAVAGAVAEAKKNGKTVALGMGGHVVKVGLAPLIIDLMERGVLSSVAFNGSCIVHDFETAYAGCTSEDVDEEIGSGAFGMAEETGSMLNKAIKDGGAEKGLGRAVGEMIEASDFPYKDKSILAAGRKARHTGYGTCGARDRYRTYPPGDGRGGLRRGHDDRL